MATAFADHFSRVAGNYAQYRPSYPDALFDWLASLTAQHQLAWDCATGNGQAALALASHFDQVIATDASQAQIAQARSHPKVRYHVAAAEQSGLLDRSIDLLTIAQALHWFNLPEFYTEAQRVLKPSGVIVAWSYGVFNLTEPEIDECLQHFYRVTLDPYWPAERKIVENGYRDLDFPFSAQTTPNFKMQTQWTFTQLLGYLRSWSACDRYYRATGNDPVRALEPQLQQLWGDIQQSREIHWPLSIRAGRYET